MTQRTRVQVTADESSPGVPYFGPNSNTTDVPLGETSIAIENLVAGTRYWVKVWNEDEFGNKSSERIQVVGTPAPKREDLFQFSANGVLDSGSPLYCYVKVPSTVVEVGHSTMTLAFRQFMAPATAAASGGGSTSGASSASSGGNTTLTVGIAPGPLTVDGTSGPASAGTAHTHDAGFYVTTLSGETLIEDIDPHTHTIAHTHSTPNHTHDLTYGTFEETYPSSHSVRVRVYKRESNAWTLVYTSGVVDQDLQDVNLTDIINSAGDWRIAVQSDAAQPNGGRLGCDVYGYLTLLS